MPYKSIALAVIVATALWLWLGERVGEWWSAKRVCALCSGAGKSHRIQTVDGELEEIRCPLCGGKGTL
jgi:hypothetical protein